MDTPDRIDRIIELERLAEVSSAARWEAAHLYYQEIESGTTKAEIAERIGKSAMHVIFMYRCWKFTVEDTGMVGVEYDALPPFSEVYNSDEVRAPADRERRKPRRQSAVEPAKEDDEEGNSGHALVVRAYNALAQLRDNPAYLPLLSGEDVNAIHRIHALASILKGACDQAS